jgi:hypothetical protein
MAKSSSIEREDFMTNDHTTAIHITHTPKEVAEAFHLPWIWKQGLEDGGPKEKEYPGVDQSLRISAAVVRYYLYAFEHGRIEPGQGRCSMNGSLNLCVNLPDAIDFLRSDYMAALATFINDRQKQPTEDEVNIIVRSILNRPHQDGIDPKLWYIDYIDIIRELRPSLVVLETVRKRLRNNAIYAPTPAELRTGVVQAGGTIEKLINDINLLNAKPGEAMKRIDELIESRPDNDDLKLVIKLCYTKIDGQQQITGSSDGRRDEEYFLEDAGD